MKYCVKCGNQLSDADIFCSNCGNKQNVENNNNENPKINVAKPNVQDNTIIASFNSNKTQEARFKQTQSCLGVCSVISGGFVAIPFLIRYTSNNYRLIKFFDSTFSSFITVFFMIIIIGIWVGIFKVFKIKASQKDEIIQFTSTRIFGCTSSKDFNVNYSDIVSIRIIQGDFFARIPFSMIIKTKSNTFNFDLSFRLFSKTECEEIRLRLNSFLNK